MPKYSDKYKELLIDELTDPKVAADYLNEHVSYDGPKAKKLLLEAFKNILEAQGATKVSKKSGVSRRTLYHSFSDKGNPTLDTVLNFLNASGLKLHFEADK